MKIRRNSSIICGLAVAVLLIGVLFVGSGPADYCDGYANDYANHHAGLGGNVTSCAVAPGCAVQSTRDWYSLYSFAYGMCMNGKARPCSL